jgi:hypothetical protein
MTISDMAAGEIYLVDSWGIGGKFLEVESVEDGVATGTILGSKRRVRLKSTVNVVRLVKRNEYKDAERRRRGWMRHWRARANAARRLNEEN